MLEGEGCYCAVSMKEEGSNKLQRVATTEAQGYVLWPCGDLCDPQAGGAGEQHALSPTHLQQRQAHPQGHLCALAHDAVPHARGGLWGQR